jgi:CBS domain-containing protein
MKAPAREETTARRPAAEKTAAELMTANPLSISAGAPVEEVVAFLADTGYSAAPVIDEAGRPVGVVSRTDVVVYDRARFAAQADVPGYYDRADLAERRGAGPAARSAPPAGAVRAIDLMTPAVFSVAPDTPVGRVAAQMVALNVHRLFVLGEGGVLVGVISALDLLRHFAGED